MSLELGQGEAEAAARTRRGRDRPHLGGEDRCNLSFTNNVEAAHYFGTLSPTPPHFGARRNDSCLPKMANNVRLLTSFGAAACWVSKCLIPFGFVWCFQPVTSLSFVSFFRLVSSLRYKMHFSLSWFNVNRGLKWQVLVQDILLSPPRSSSNIFSLWGNLEGALKEQLVGFLSTNWLVLRFLSLAASWEHILRMDSGVAKVNPGPPSVSSNQVCKSCKNTSRLVDPEWWWGTWAVLIGTKKSQKCHSQNTNWVNLCLREQQQNQLASQGCEKLWICSVSKEEHNLGCRFAVWNAYPTIKQTHN